MGDNNNSEQFNVVGTEKKKKQMGPITGLLIALVIAIIIIAVGLLIRMIISDDGDYFKPFKTMFGIESSQDEEDDDDEPKSSKKVNKSEDVIEKKKFSSNRYTLLSDDVDDKDIKHYRLTIDVGEMVKPLIDELNKANTKDNSNSKNSSTNLSAKSNTNSSTNSSMNVNTNSSTNSSMNVNTNSSTNSSMNVNTSSNANTNTSTNSGQNGAAISEMEAIALSADRLEEFLDMYMMILSQMSDMIDGEIYFDIYFEGNEIIQIVIGYDYSKLLNKFYEYILEESEDDFKAEGIESVDDFAEYVVKALDEVIDEDQLYDMLTETIDDFEDTIKSMGIKEKDIKEAIEFCNEKGVIEAYIYGTTKLKGLFSMVLDSEDFQDSLKDMEKETGVKLDKENVIESIIKASNKSSDFKEAGLKFVEVD